MVTIVIDATAELVAEDGAALVFTGKQIDPVQMV